MDAQVGSGQLTGFIPDCQLVAGGDGQIDALPVKHVSYLHRVLM